MFDGSIWASIGVARKLQSLDLSGCCLDVVKSWQLAGLTELRRLRLDAFSGFSCGDTANFGTVFKSLQKLESVSLTTDRCACLDPKDPDPLQTSKAALISYDGVVR